MSRSLIYDLPKYYLALLNENMFDETAVFSNRRDELFQRTRSHRVISQELLLALKFIQESGSIDSFIEYRKGIR